MAAHRRNAPKQKSLDRRGASRNPKPWVIVCCEGKKSEPRYVNEVAKHFSNNLIDVKVHPALGVPKTVVDFACDIKRDLKREARRTRDSFDDMFHIWCVFDVDEHPKLKESIKKADDNQIGVALSNPCFELWIVYHYTDHHAPCSSGEIQKQLEGHMPDYSADKNKAIAVDQIISNTEKAIERADRSLSRRAEEGKPRGNPSTNIQDLVKLIKEYGRG